MPVIVLVLQVVLALVFVAAATAKALRSDEFVAALRLSHLPEPVALILAWGVPLLEAALAFWLMLSPPAQLPLAFAAAALLLAAFTLWMGWVEARALHVHCGCFGGNGGEVGRATIARNLGLLVVAGIGWIAASNAISPLPGASPDLVATVVAVGLSVALLQALRLAWPHLAISYDAFQRQSAAVEGE